MREDERRLGPPPGLVDLPRLMESLDAVGLPCELVVEGDERPLSSAIDLSAYRGRPLTADLLREVSDLIMGVVRDQLAEVRGETPPPEFFRRPPAREAS